MVAFSPAFAWQRSLLCRRRPAAAGLACAALLAGLMAATPAGAAPPPHSDYAGSSADGSRVYFVTNQPLLPSDTDTKNDVYERSDGTTTLISQGEINGQGNYSAAFAGASTDGSRVLFISFEQLVSADTDAALDIYQRAEGATTLISQGEVNGNEPFNANRVAASFDGSRVLFETRERLVLGDTDEVRDLYMRAGGLTTRVTQGEINGNEPLEFELVGSSIDVSRVFFDTKERLLPADTDSALDTYERSSGVTQLVSRGDINGNMEENSRFAGTAVDGTIVVFETTESLVAADTDTARDVYQRVGSTTTLVSQGEINGNRIVAADAEAVSADGSRVVFSSFEQLAPQDTDAARDIYLRAGGATTLLSDGVGQDDNSDARFVAASADAGRVIYETDESQLPVDTDGGWRDVYVRENGTTTLASVGVASADSPVQAHFAGASDDGSVVFVSTREKLTADDTDNFADIYEHRGAVVTRVTVGAINGNDAAGAAYTGSSADGSRVFFSTSEQLTRDDADQNRDVYERHGGTTTLVSTGNSVQCGKKLVPKIEGTAFADVLTGSGGIDFIDAAAGDDRVAGKGGGDCVQGGAGKDELRGQGGGDAMRGGAGADRMTGGGGRDRIKGDEGADNLRGGASFDRVAGGPGSDNLRGDGGKDKLNGNGGGDVINAADGAADRVNCGTGDDRAKVDGKDKVSRNCESVRRRR